MRIVVAGLTLAIAGMAASPGSEPTRGDIEVRRDVVYREVDNTELRLDAYLPPGRGVHPAVVLIHGGGWVIGAKGAFESFARQLAGEGFVAFDVDYRLAPAYPYPAAVNDLVAAVKWVRAQAGAYRVDPGRIAALGGSAGGHLAALLATLGERSRESDARLAAAVSWAGPMDLHTDQNPLVTQAYIGAFLGCFLQPCDEQTVVAASPISHVDASDPPILLVNGTDDVLVPADQAQRMADALASAGVSRELLLLPGVGHDATLPPAATDPSIEFLHERLGSTSLAPPWPAPVPGDGTGGAIIVVPLALLATGVLGLWLRRRFR